ncbi:MAG: helix-turn-helix domain-containing protein, partial [Acidimicrobiales bacterium]
MSRRYYPPDGHIIQAFSFALDPTVEQKRQISRFFGARRKAFNWTLDQIKAELERYRETGEPGAPPTFYSLR